MKKNVQAQKNIEINGNKLCWQEKLRWSLSIIVCIHKSLTMSDNDHLATV